METATLDLVRDVELDLKIELGRTQMYLEDVLKLRKGAVVPLDKLAGDPVDICVNGRLIARGEVLVLNDNFCVRVAELIVGGQRVLLRSRLLHRTASHTNVQGSANMPSLITLLGSCLAAAGTMYPWSAAVAADLPANPAAEPWWSNPPPAVSPLSGPKITEHDRRRVAAAAAQGRGNRVARRAGQGAEFAPDPPGLLRPDPLPAAFQRDSAPVAETGPTGRHAAMPAEKMKSRSRFCPTQPPLPPQPRDRPAAAGTAAARGRTRPRVARSPLHAGRTTRLGNSARPGQRAPTARMPRARVRRWPR